MTTFDIQKAIETSETRIREDISSLREDMKEQAKTTAALDVKVDYLAKRQSMMEKILGTAVAGVASSLWAHIWGLK